MPDDRADVIEWVALGPRTVVVAAAERAWLHDPGVFAQQDPFAGVMHGRGSIASTDAMAPSTASTITVSRLSRASTPG